MALDGAFLHILANNFKNAEGAFVEKIYQPSKNELILLMRKKGFNKKLYISVAPSLAVVRFTSAQNDNPPAPPMFCMLLRKHLGAAKLTEVFQPALERILFFKFSATTEMGDRAEITLYVELLSGRPNIILIGPQGKIIDALYRSDLEKNTRIIQPGATYTMPQSQNKLSVLSSDFNELANIIKSKTDVPLHSAVLSVLDGVSPLIAREIAYLTANDIDLPAHLCNTEQLSNTLLLIKNSIINADKLCIVSDENSKVLDFSYIPIKQYSPNYNFSVFDDPCDLLEEFYSKKQGAKASEQKAKDIIKLLKTTKERILRKTELRKKDLKKCENREQLRLYGELLKANIHLIKNGSPFADVQNYYDENLATIRIPLDPALSVAQNAAKYFKEYKKTYSAEQTLTTLIEQDKDELKYIESVLESLERADSSAEIEEIKKELTLSGYLRPTKNSAVQKKNLSAPLEFTSKSGLKVYVGKNNLQNDYLTLKFASKGDYWFHTKNIPGSHVIVATGENEIDDDTIVFAATLAKQHSKAADSTKVAVDYTRVKNVKKPSGAKPGMVIYLTNKTILID